jgi:hypothetical protein
MNQPSNQIKFLDIFIQTKKIVLICNLALEYYDIA